MTATDDRLETETEGVPVAAGAGPGAQLRLARETAGLSLEQVAQQLKLAPRQVKALEEEDFTRLPGRTFARGFVRNYARLLNLDANELIALLPDVAQLPAMEAPALQSTGSTIAELPGTAPARLNFARWLIPLALVGCIVAAAAYEWYRGGLPNLNEPQHASDSGAEIVAQAPASASTTLPNPLATDANSAANAPAASIANANPSSISDAPVPAVPAAAPATSAATSAVKSDAIATGDAPLLLSFRGPSWAEVRDRSGQTLIMRLVAAGSVEPIRGSAPFDIVLGNAPMVTLAYRGKTIDLAPYTRQNVARMRLQ